MKKRFAALALVLAAMLLLSGCSLVLDIETKINKDGSGTFSAFYGLDEELYNNLVTYGGGDDVSQFQPIKHNGQTLYGEEIAEEFSSLDELNQAMNSYVDGSMGTFAPFLSFEATSTSVQGVLNNDFLGDELAEIQSYGIEFAPTLSFTFDGTVTQTNGKLSNGNHTVSYNMLTDSVVDITVSEGGSSIGLIIGIIIGVLVLGGVITLIVIKSKKSRTPRVTPAPTQSFDPMQTFGSTQQAPNSRFCSQCGAQVADGAAFCDKCGAPLHAPMGSFTSNAAMSAEGNMPVFQQENDPNKPNF